MGAVLAWWMAVLIVFAPPSASIDRDGHHVIVGRRLFDAIRVNVVAELEHAWGPNIIDGERRVRSVKVSDDHTRVWVVCGKKTHAAIDLRTGEVLYLGS